MHRYWLIVLPLVPLLAGAAIIPLQESAVDKFPSIVVTVGTPPRAIRVRADFTEDFTQLIHPEICPPFVDCVAAEPLSSPMFADPVHVNTTFVNAEGYPLVLTTQPLSFGSFVDPAAEIGIDTDAWTHSDVGDLGGILALSPRSRIAQTAVMEINTETFQLPNGSTQFGFSLTVVDTQIEDGPNDVVLPIAGDGDSWSVDAVPSFGQADLTDDASATFHIDPEITSSIKVPESVLVRIMTEVNELGGSSFIGGVRLYAPCLQEGQIDPLGLLTLRFEQDQVLHVNIRGSAAVLPLLPAPVMRNGTHFCPTVIALADVEEAYVHVSPQFFTDDVKIFFDGPGSRIVIRQVHTARDPLPVQQVTPIPSFTLPGDGVRFQATTGPDAWRLESVHPQPIEGGALAFTLYAYHDGPPADFNGVTNFDDDLWLVGDGTVRIEHPVGPGTPIAFSLPIVTGGGEGQRYRLQRVIHKRAANYYLIPVGGDESLPILV